MPFILFYTIFSGLSAPETVKKDFTILSFILQHAVENGLCSINPALKSIRIPRVERADKTAYTQDEYNKAYEFAKNHPNGLPIMLMLETGISRSELLGLRWEDIDTENRVLHIRQGLVAYQDLDEKTWVMEASGLKNAYRRRDVPLVDDTLVNRLKSTPKKIWVKRKGEPCQTVVEPEFVFHSPEGLPYQPNNWSNRVYFPFMHDLVQAHPELPLLTPHELRHTCATIFAQYRPFIENFSPICLLLCCQYAHYSYYIIVQKRQTICFWLVCDIREQ